MQVTTEEIIYPSSDGQPMAESTIQYELIVKIKEGCESLFKNDPNVFVAADLMWYPVEGRPDISQSTGCHGNIWQTKGRSTFLPAI